ncbi:uncharacterized protein LOC132196693 [Neocloeon triangulifer]|uniref:uncharacterized protein LOC132196693 n=1 Tax=Neocloeon triangulifer TaxID=2078957 RepID=UPI00286F0932|nr:uncharacterized protein LOC132196693 [Neocloeon triangulifer]
MLNSTQRMLVLFSILCSLLLASEARIELLNSKYVGKDSHHKKPSGLMPLRSVAGRAGDSNTYYVKLPASTHYYSSLSSKIPYEPHGHAAIRRLLPVSFAGNGRPARVYHWNIPVIQHMELEKNMQRRRSSFDHQHAQQRTAHHDHYPAKTTVQIKRYRKKSSEDSPIHRISGTGNKKMNKY